MHPANTRRATARRHSWLFLAAVLAPWPAAASPDSGVPDDDIPTIPSAAQLAITPDKPVSTAKPEPAADDAATAEIETMPDESAPAAKIEPTVDEPTATAVPETTQIEPDRRALAAIPDRWARCPPASPAGLRTEAADPEKIDLHADSAESGPDDVYTLKGNAVVQQGAQRVTADRIVYRRETGEITADGAVRFSAPGLEVDAGSASIQTAEHTGRLEQLDYALPDLHARGSARSLELEGRTRQRFKDVSYTTCAGDEPDWLLSAKQVELDHEAGRGTARGAKLKIKGMTVARLPYMSFPTEKRRKSGLLSPSYGQSNETGTDVSLPYYVDIAPNYDATILPRLMTDRGLMLGGEFRYLHDNNRGEIRAEYLESDKRLNDRERSLFSINHSGRPVPRLGTWLRASSVSDEEYFEDIGTTIVQTSQTSLERSAGADWYGDWWTADIFLQDFQNVDPAVASIDRPYKQLPRVALHAAPPARPLGLKFSASAEFSSFDHSDGDRVTGKRIDLQPRVSLPLNRAAWFVEPAVSVRHTRYDLDTPDPGADARPSRTTPVISVDAGSFFERNTRWGETALLQTLEPRAFYLYVPDKNQADIPLFDTGSFDFNYQTLFRDNRFTGPDRMGDANQAALAVTTRLLDPARGRQILRASLGSLLYFGDREVTLPGEAVAREDSSDLIGEVSMQLGETWNASAELQWNPHESQTSRNNIRLQYRSGARQIVNASYRRRRDRQEQADFSFLWPVNPSWHMVGRWYYSLDANETLEAIAGVGYESCCWGARLIGRNYINDNENSRNTAVFMQLELKGLGATGSRVDDVLERGILGYQSSN